MQFEVLAASKKRYRWQASHALSQPRYSSKVGTRILRHVTLGGLDIIYIYAYIAHNVVYLFNTSIATSLFN